MNQTTTQGKVRQSAGSSNSGRNCVRWSFAEDRAPISAMNDLLDIGGWKADNGQFKNGAYARLEILMELKLPGCEKKAKPHIESRVKLLRRQYDAIAEMLSPSASGFGWNAEQKFVTCPQSVWDEWIKSHKNAAGLRNKPFPFYDDLGRIFGKDRATGDESGNAQDALEEMEEEDRGVENEHVPVFNTSETIPTPQGNQMGPQPSVTSSATPSTIRTKKAKTETIEALKEFSAKLGKMTEMMEVAGEHIGRLANCFKHESDSAERRMQITAEVMKIEGLTPTQVLSVSKKIALNPLEVDFFFSLPDDYKYAYIQGLLIPDQ